MQMEMAFGLSVLAGMATPAVLLLANAMFILSTIQRLQAILARVRETELAMVGEAATAETEDRACCRSFWSSMPGAPGSAIAPFSASIPRPPCSWWSCSRWAPKC